MYKKYSSIKYNYITVSIHRFDLNSGCLARIFWDRIMLTDYFMKSFI